MNELFTADYYRGIHYSEYFKTRHWKELREQLIDSNSDAKCWICSKKNTLLIHHVSYANLFHEKLHRDIYIVCYDCHERIHFKLNGDKVLLVRRVLLKRMKMLKYTYPIRSFRLGSSINTIFNYLFFGD